MRHMRIGLGNIDDILHSSGQEFRTNLRKKSLFVILWHLLSSVNFSALASFTYLKTK